MPVWQKAHEAVLLVYKLTGAFPESEKVRADQSNATCGRVHHQQHR
jgi:hypothetical protein